jgi:hypothetical protein
MAEPQPPNVKEGADQPDVLPASAEDRKAAQAMSSLDARGDEETSAPKKEADLKALGEALKSLDMSQAQSKRTESAKKEEAPKKLIKVDQADVALLVSWIWVALHIAECGTEPQSSRLNNLTSRRSKPQTCYELMMRMLPRH